MYGLVLVKAFKVYDFMVSFRQVDEGLAMWALACGLALPLRTNLVSCLFIQKPKGKRFLCFLL